MSQAAQLGDWETRPMFALRPRRWYTNEIAPHGRDVRLTTRLWRYRALVRRTRTTPPYPRRRRCVLLDRRDLNEPMC